MRNSYAALTLAALILIGCNKPIPLPKCPALHWGRIGDCSYATDAKSQIYAEVCPSGAVWEMRTYGAYIESLLYTSRDAAVDGFNNSYFRKCSIWEANNAR